MNTPAARKMRRGPGRPDERGFGVLVVLLLVVALTLMGTTVLSATRGDAAAAGVRRRSEVALGIAEAGIAFGIEQLRSAYGIEATLDFPAAFDDAHIINSGDCASAACPLFNWHELTAGPASFAGGTYRVAVKDDDDGDGDPKVDPNQRILLRSLGTDVSGAQRLLEVAITLQP